MSRKRKRKCDTAGTCRDPKKRKLNKSKTDENTEEVKRAALAFDIEAGGEDFNKHPLMQVGAAFGLLTKDYKVKILKRISIYIEFSFEEIEKSIIFSINLSEVIAIRFQSKFEIMSRLWTLLDSPKKRSKREKFSGKGVEYVFKSPKKIKGIKKIKKRRRKSSKSTRKKRRKTSKNIKKQKLIFGKCLSPKEFQLNNANYSKNDSNPRTVYTLGKIKVPAPPKIVKIKVER
ncbi:unnamed protein product, partial [marine sediment metagenome]